MTHETDEELSALIDGELADEAAARVRAHAASCADCAARMDKLGAASLMFQRSGERPVPAGVVEKVEEARKPRRASLEYVLVMVATIGVVLVSGAMLKKFMPSLFNNINQMITGAASASGTSK